MGYSHGKKWNDAEIEKEIKRVMEKAKIQTMPTRSLMDEITGSMALSSKVSRTGGTKGWAERLGIEIKPCESKLGYEYECKCMNILQEMGYDCELTKVRYPYDIIADNNIKIDVKVGNLYHSNKGNFYTFNLEKKHPTCDLFICFCLNEDNTDKIYVIPSCVLSGKKQLSIGEHKSKYDRYIDSWQYVNIYNCFYEKLI